MVKGVESDNWSKLQPAKAKVKHKLIVVKRDTLFFLHRFWFLIRRNRLLFWGGVTTFAILFGASLALVTPLWSDPNALERQYSGKGLFKTRAATNTQYQLSRSVNILIMGVDPLSKTKDSSQVFTGASDTMLLVQLNPNDKTIRLLSIPKDSQVVIPEVGLEKISLANSIGGTSLAARVVSRTLNNVPIDRYISITTNAFRELVDQLGGVEVFVPKKMLYRDATQKLEIDLDPGWQTLNGEQAEQFVRYRDSANGELTRVQRQQVLIAALRDRLMSPASLARLPRLIHIIQNSVDTNLSLQETLALVNFVVQQENLHMVMLPGNLSPFSKDPSSYWLHSSGINSVMGEFFGVRASNVVIKPRSLYSLKIAVQNASGEPTLSDSFVNYLKNKGFDNVYTVPNWSDVQRQTQIIAQQGNLEAATNLKQTLGLGNIESSSTGDLESDITIRVGQDWDNSNNWLTF